MSTTKTAAATARHAQPVRPPPQPDVPSLARALIGQLVTGKDYEPSLHDVDGDAQEFLFDGEVDGHRLIVIRPRPVVARAAVLLSPREREIARMVAKGYPNKTIAAVLEISTWTVGTYMRRVFAKLAVGTRASMVARLIEEGLLADRHLPCPSPPTRPPL